MKLNKIKIILFVLLVLSSNLEAQKIKIKFSSVQYEWLPALELPSEYNKYAVHVSSDATDGIPQSLHYSLTRESYIPKLENVSEVKTQGGSFLGNKILNLSTDTYGGGSPPDLLLRVILGNINITNKEIYTGTPPEAPASTETYFSYKLSFQFKFKIKLVDANNGKIIIDTLIDNPKLLTYPENFNINTDGSPSSKIWFHNKFELDRDLDRNMKSILEKSKMLLTKNCMGETSSIMTGLYGFTKSDQSFPLVTIKSKKIQFNVFDTLSVKMEALYDSISLNCKNQIHKNWHLPVLKSKAAELFDKVKTVTSDESILSEFKESKEKDKFTNSMKINLMMLCLLQDRFDEAKQTYNEIEAYYSLPQNRDDYVLANLSAIAYLLRREHSIYERHKQRFYFR